MRAAYDDVIAVAGALDRPGLLESSRATPNQKGRYPGSAGGYLLSYGENLRSNYRAGAVYMDKIKRGANPAELPVEQPTRFELVINIKTAKRLSLAVPQGVLLLADDVIQ